MGGGGVVWREGTVGYLVGVLVSVGVSKWRLEEVSQVGAAAC